MPPVEFASLSGPSTGDEFSTEFNASLGAPWTAQFEDSTTMATASGTGTAPVPLTPAPNDDITPWQRMVSATAGNVLTGLLGTSQEIPTLEIEY
jgi:hypothetical protein